MQIAQARQPLTAAALSLIVCAACIAALLPPFNERFFGTVPLTVLLGLAIAVSAVLHLVFVGISARRLGRSPLLWVVLALLAFPVASIVGLILLEWLGDSRNQSGDKSTA